MIMATGSLGSLCQTLAPEEGVPADLPSLPQDPGDFFGTGEGSSPTSGTPVPEPEPAHNSCPVYDSSPGCQRSAGTPLLPRARALIIFDPPWLPGAFEEHGLSILWAFRAVKRLGMPKSSSKNAPAMPLGTSRRVNNKKGPDLSLCGSSPLTALASAARGRRELLPRARARWQEWAGTPPRVPGGPSAQLGV